MGEIDTKPIESVQTALSFFGHRNDQRKTSSPTKDDQEVEKEREVESLEKELANLKLQLEAKDSAYKQALLKLDHHHKTADELSILLRNSDSQKDYYIGECREANARLNELESALDQLARQLSESGKVKEQLSHVTNELESTRGRLLNMENELVVLQQAKLDSLTQAQAMERTLSEERLKREELLRQASEMKETIVHLKVKADEAERENADVLSAKDAELESLAKAVSDMKEQLESAMKKVKMMHDVENQIVEKSAYIDSLQLQLNAANELRLLSERAGSDAVSELNKLKESMDLQEKKNSDQAAYIGLLETELKTLSAELESANAEACSLKEFVESTKTELEKAREKENDAQVEIALLKSELHKGRSKLAAAEARAQSEKSALYNALQQMGLEAEETKRENRVLKELAMKSGDETSIESHKDDEETLHENGKETEDMKKELEAAMTKIGELRTRAEQAISRAEAAEKAKTALEDHIQRRKERKEKRKAAIAALREESFPIDYDSSESVKYESSSKNYQPLGKEPAIYRLPLRLDDRAKSLQIRGESYPFSTAILNLRRNDKDALRSQGSQTLEQELGRISSHSQSSLNFEMEVRSLNRDAFSHLLRLPCGVHFSSQHSSILRGL
ncbi:hypothetical protein Salat_0035700 [Sesamum alatum]|uniref:Uncharacterized protein n=1 Tax=Sesamum alatum TaxID=300844 RepID=A0AAE1YVZ7_9LAMI|nr:hypothetical protein Salat_0035700 [Sesamum alatum]